MFLKAAWLMVLAVLYTGLFSFASRARVVVRVVRVRLTRRGVYIRDRSRGFLLLVYARAASQHRRTLAFVPVRRNERDTGDGMIERARVSGLVFRARMNRESFFSGFFGGLSSFQAVCTWRDPRPRRRRKASSKN